MTKDLSRLSDQDRKKAMDLVQDHLEINKLSARSLHDTLMVAPNIISDANGRPIDEQLREFVARLTNSLANRADMMDSNLNRAKQHQTTGTDAARRSCLEQAQAQWSWFTWILENQSTPLGVIESPCPVCGLRKPDQHQEKCRSCYDMDIMNAVIR